MTLLKNRSDSYTGTVTDRHACNHWQWCCSMAGKQQVEMQGAKKTLARSCGAAHPSGTLYRGSSIRGQCRACCAAELGAAQILFGRLLTACAVARLEGHHAYRPRCSSSVSLATLRLGGSHVFSSIAKALRPLGSCCACSRCWNALRCACMRAGVRERQLFAHAQPGREAQDRTQDGAPQKLQRVVARGVLHAEAAALVQPPRITVLLCDLHAGARHLR